MLEVGKIGRKPPKSLNSFLSGSRKSLGKGVSKSTIKPHLLSPNSKSEGVSQRKVIFELKEGIKESKKGRVSSPGHGIKADNVKGLLGFTRGFSVDSNSSSGFYKEPKAGNRVFSWELLIRLHSIDNLHWLCGGDFNELLFRNEKKDRSDKSFTNMLQFREVVNDCDLVDLGFSGSMFTWNNKRDGKANIQERLDRFLANSKWKDRFVNSRLSGKPGVMQLIRTLEKEVEEDRNAFLNNGKAKDPGLVVAWATDLREEFQHSRLVFSHQPPPPQLAIKEESARTSVSLSSKETGYQVWWMNHDRVIRARLMVSPIFLMSASVEDRSQSGSPAGRKRVEVTDRHRCRPPGEWVVTTTTKIFRRRPGSKPRCPESRSDTIDGESKKFQFHDVSFFVAIPDKLVVVDKPKLLVILARARPSRHLTGKVLHAESRFLGLCIIVSNYTKALTEGIASPADAATTRKDIKARFFINQSLDPVDEALQSQLSLKKGKDETQKNSKSRQWGQNSQNRKGGASSSSQGIGRWSNNNNNNNNNNNTNQRNKSQIQCFNCKKFGHYRAECRSRKQNFQANVAEDGGRSETLLLACNMAEDGAKNKWFLDSGCSNHMCGEKEMFTQLDESFTSSVKFGNDTTVPVMGKGKISITLKDGSQNAISDVLFVPNLHKNLLSVGQLSEKGYDIRIHEGICTINSAQKGLIAKVKMSQNRLFPLLINSDSLPCFSSVMCDENWLWHMRFGHVNFGSLKQLASRKMVSGLPSINPPDRVCETCVLGKKHRDPGKGSSSDVNVDLEEIVQEEPTHVTPPPCVTPHLAESSSRPQHQRVLPARLQDCVLSNDDYPTDEELVNFALFADCDPVTYEDATQDDYWMKAMNEEICAIEKNNT
ncbi:hypothetical protein EZV62_008308 [Acer yangbiense]|uniref:CCHC-type domain-containing protein n=1 Tax=Acer yangbiense TaxID=1000413 RepID=A0A5C7ICJ0_9ROSI|nr:hypothetical protein EZV62_008308 [Acer yangbiense]